MLECGTALALIPELAITNGLLNNTSLLSREVEDNAARLIALATRETYPKLEEFESLANLIKKTQPSHELELTLEI